MANIIIDSYCNLHCPYCFANDVIEAHKDFIPLDSFDHILDFVLKSNDKRVGLIGGEPLLHPEFLEICKHVISKTPHDFIAVVYTNGVLLDKYMKVLSSSRFRLLVNVNSPKDQGEDNFLRMRKNLDEIFFEYFYEQKVTLGLNLYKKDQDISFFLDLVDRYQGYVKAIRTSVSVPWDKSKGAFHTFKEMMPLVKHLLKEMNKRNIGIMFDCSQIPVCLIDEELAKLMFYSEKLSRKPYITGSRCSSCSPVIDIDQRGLAIRCFAMSEYLKVNIDDFNNLEELSNYFRYQIDRKLRNNPLDECKDCEEFSCQLCSGGCLSFRLDLFNKNE